MTGPLADLEVRYHSAMPNWCKVLGLKIRVIPECEGGGFAIAKDQAEAIAALRNTVVPTQLQCPECGVWHVDEGEWATKPHRTHLCAACGWTWRPYEVATVGVPPTVATSLSDAERDELQAEIAKLKDRLLWMIDGAVKSAHAAHAKVIEEMRKGIEEAKR